MKQLLILLLLIATGCGASWPKACKNDLSTINCDCKKLRFVVVPDPAKPSPFGLLVTSCDGEILPLKIKANSFRTEAAPHDN